MSTGSCPAPTVPGAPQAPTFPRPPTSGWALESSGPPRGPQEGEGRVLLAGHLARCPQSQAGAAHEGWLWSWLGAENSSLPLNRHRQSVEILETSDLCRASQELSGSAWGRALALCMRCNPFPAAPTNKTKNETPFSRELEKLCRACVPAGFLGEAGHAWGHRRDLLFYFMGF